MVSDAEFIDDEEVEETKNKVSLLCLSSSPMIYQVHRRIRGRAARRRSKESHGVKKPSNVRYVPGLNAHAM